MHFFRLMPPENEEAEEKEEGMEEEVNPEEEVAPPEGARTAVTEAAAAMATMPRPRRC